MFRKNFEHNRPQIDSKRNEANLKSLVKHFLHKTLKRELCEEESAV